MNTMYRMCVSLLCAALTIGEVVAEPFTDGLLQAGKATQTQEANESSEVFGDVDTLKLEAYPNKKVGELSTYFHKGSVNHVLKLSGPIDENKQEGDFADLDGLKNGVTLSYGFEYRLNGTLYEAQTRFSDALKVPCQTLVAENLHHKKKLYFDCQDKAEKRYALLQQVMLDQLSAEVAKLPRSQQPALILADFKPMGMTLAEFKTSHCKVEGKAYLDAPNTCTRETFSDKTVWDSAVRDHLLVNYSAVGATLSVGTDEIEYFKKATLEEGKQQANNKAFSVYYSLFYARRYSRLKVGLTAQDYFRPASSREVCLPLAEVAGSMSCKSGSYGAPKNIKNTLLFFEYAKYLGKGDQFAYSLKLTHDLEANTTGIDFPVYLWTKKGGNDLSGGVRFSWMSASDRDDDGILDPDVSTFSIFMSKPFSIM